MTGMLVITGCPFSSSFGTSTIIATPLGHGAVHFVVVNYAEVQDIEFGVVAAEHLAHFEPVRVREGIVDRIAIIKGCLEERNGVGFAGLRVVEFFVVALCGCADQSLNG